jgi:predicted XRE-type DNA-binding protein
MKQSNPNKPIRVKTAEDLGKALAARGESTIGRAPGYCGQDQGARRRRCGAIVDDEQRRYCPQYPGAQRVPAAQGHLLRWRSSTIIPHRLRRAAWHLPLRRSERGLLYFHHGLLGLSEAETGEMEFRSELTLALAKIIRNGNLTHAEIAKKAGTSRTRVTAIANGNTQGVSTDLLIRVLSATGHKAELRVRRVAA